MQDSFKNNAEMAHPGSDLGVSHDTTEESLQDRLREALRLQEHSPELVNGFNPEIIDDAEGIQRTVYSFTDISGHQVQIVFTPREELADISQITNDRQSFLIARQPKWRPTKEWNEYLKKFAASAVRGVPEPRLNPGSISETTRKQNISFFVQQNLQSIVDAAGLLGYSNSELQKIRFLLHQNSANQVIDELTDMIIASNIFSTDGEEKIIPDTEGEALMLAFLCGDKKASEILHARLGFLQETDRENEAKYHASIQKISQNDEKDRSRLLSQLDDEILRLREQDFQSPYQDELINDAKSRRLRAETSEFESLDPQELVAVHATTYEPRKTSTGWEMNSAFEGSGRANVRQTIHFSMNHLVESHSKGNWEDKPVIVISSFAGMMQTAGKPRKLNTVDTYWEMSPGKKLELPNDGTVIVKPGKVHDSERIWEKQDGVVVYKTSPYSLQDIEWFVSNMEERDIKEMNYKILSSIRWQVINSLSDGNKALKILYKFVDDQSFLIMFYDQKQYQIMNELTEALGLSGTEADAVREKIMRILQNKTEYLVRQAIVNEQTREMGYRVREGGEHGWEDDHYANIKIGRMGAKFGAMSGSHFKSPEWELEGLLEEVMIDVRENKMSNESLHNAMQRIGDIESIITATPGARRMMYEVGAIL